MNTCDVSIVFRWYELDGEYMHIAVVHQGQHYSITPDEHNQSSFNLRMTLPCAIEIRFWGKKVSDTKVDEQGNILADKCVIIEQIRLDNMPVDSFWLAKAPKLITDHGSVNSNYIGFNGTMHINLDESDVFRLWHKWQKVGQIS